MDKEQDTDDQAEEPKDTVAEILLPECGEEVRDPDEAGHEPDKDDREEEDEHGRKERLDEDDCTGDDVNDRKEDLPAHVRFVDSEAPEREDPADKPERSHEGYHDLGRDPRRCKEHEAEKER